MHNIKVKLEVILRISTPAFQILVEADEPSVSSAVSLRRRMSNHENPQYQPCQRDTKGILTELLKRENDCEIVHSSDHVDGVWVVFSC